MAATPQTVITGIKTYYEQETFTDRTIDKVLFPFEDNQLVAGVSVDEYIGNTNFAVRTTAADGSSNVRNYAPGSGYVATPPHQKEAVPIGQDLIDAVAAGVDANRPADEHLRQKIRQILYGAKNGLLPASWMTRNKAAIDVARLGKLTFTDSSGETSEEYDFSRAAANDTTYDSTAGGATFDEALEVALAGPIAAGIPKNRIAMILGASWLSYFNADSGVQEKRKYMNPNIVDDQMREMTDMAEGLYAVSSYTPNSLPMAVRIMGYQPSQLFLRKKGGTAEPFVPDNEIVIFAYGAPGWRFNRQMTVLNDARQHVQVVGEAVIDGFASDDPAVTFVRLNQRYFYAFGNVNFTGRCVGTFA